MAIPFIYSFSGNCAASAPISTFMCLWAIYIFPGLVHIFPPAEKADPSWEYIIRSQTHDCGNWDWDLNIPFLGIYVSNFRHFVSAVWLVNTKISTRQDLVCQSPSIISTFIPKHNTMLSTLETRDNLQRNIGLWCKIHNFTLAKYFLLSLLYFFNLVKAWESNPLCGKSGCFVWWWWFGRWLEDGWGRGNYTYRIPPAPHPPPPPPCQLRLSAT